MLFFYKNSNKFLNQNNFAQFLNSKNVTFVTIKKNFLKNSAYAFLHQLLINNCIAIFPKNQITSNLTLDEINELITDVKTNSNLFFMGLFFNQQFYRTFEINQLLSNEKKQIQINLCSSLQKNKIQNLKEAFCFKKVNKS